MENNNMICVSVRMTREEYMALYSFSVKRTEIQVKCSFSITKTLLSYFFIYM